MKTRGILQPELNITDIIGRCGCGSLGLLVLIRRLQSHALWRTAIYEKLITSDVIVEWSLNQRLPQAARQRRPCGEISGNGARPVRLRESV